MNNYIVYEKEDCECPWGTNVNQEYTRDEYGICIYCHCTGRTMKEVPLDRAILNILMSDSFLSSEIRNILSEKA